MIFVAGGTGFLGSHLLYKLVQLNEPIRALYRDEKKLDQIRKFGKYYPSGNSRLIDKIEWVKGDMLDYYTLSEYLEGVTQVYNAAGLVSFKDEDKKKLFTINVQGTANLVNACLERKISRLCHVSSIASLGQAIDGKLIEETRLWDQASADSPYSISKFRGEMEVWRGIYEGLNAVIVNPAVIIGPGMWHTAELNIFRLIYSKGLRYYPTGASGYVDVGDVTQAMVSLMHSDIHGERFIISAENLTHREVLGFLADALERPRPARPLSPLLIKAACNFEKVRAFVVRKPRRITTRSLQSVTSVCAYSHDKLVQAIPMKFVPIQETLVSSARFFVNEQPDKL
jgi:dihydroflavonol-4-reductase